MTRQYVPEAQEKIAFGKFHIAGHLGDAVDRVRRAEHRRLASVPDQRAEQPADQRRPHSPESALIRIEAERDGVHVTTSVDDRGSGVDPDRLTHPLPQASPTRTSWETTSG